MFLLKRLLNRAVIDGTLIVIDPAGRRNAFGSGEGPALAVRLGSPLLALHLALDPLGAAAAAYADGTLVIEDGDIGQALELLARNLGGFAGRTLSPGPLTTLSPRRGAAHLDLDPQLFTALLGPLAWYHAGRHDGGAADEGAISWLTARANLAAGQRVLVSAPDAGALALAVLAAAPVTVAVIPASRHAAERLQAEATARGCADRLSLESRLPDSPVSLDRAILVGALEDQGLGGPDRVLPRLARILKPRGLAVLQDVMGRGAAPPPPGWAARFRPGWRPPSLARTIAAGADCGLWLQQLTLLGRDGPLTVGAWISALEREEARIVHLYNAPFLRSWQVALGGLFLALTAGRLGVYEQILSPRREGGS